MNPATQLDDQDMIIDQYKFNRPCTMYGNFRKFLLPVILLIFLLIITWALIYRSSKQTTDVTTQANEYNGGFNLGDFGFENSKTQKKFQNRKYSTYPTDRAYNASTYIFKLNIASIADEWVDATSELIFEATTPNKIYNFDLSEQTIKVIKVDVVFNGTKTASQFGFYNTDKLSVILNNKQTLSKTTNKITITFEFKIKVLNNIARGLYRVPTENGDFTLQTNLSNGNVKYVFPSFDLFRTNRSFQFSTITPQGYKTTGNGTPYKEYEKNKRRYTDFGDFVNTRFSSFGWVIGRLNYENSFKKLTSKHSYENVVRIISLKNVNKTTIGRILYAVMNIYLYFMVKLDETILRIVFVPTLEDHQDISLNVIVIDEYYLYNYETLTELEWLKLKGFLVKGVLKQLFGFRLKAKNEMDEWVVEAISEALERTLFYSVTEGLFENNPKFDALVEKGYHTSKPLGVDMDLIMFDYDPFMANFYSEDKAGDFGTIMDRCERIYRGVYFIKMLIENIFPRLFLRKIDKIFKHKPEYLTFTNFRELYIKDGYYWNPKLNDIFDDVVYKSGVVEVDVQITRNSKPEYENIGDKKSPWVLKNESFHFNAKQRRFFLKETAIRNLQSLKQNYYTDDIQFKENKKENTDSQADNKVEEVPYLTPITIDSMFNEFICPCTLLYMNQKSFISVDKSMENKSPMSDKNIIGFNTTNPFLVLSKYFPMPKENYDLLFKIKSTEYLIGYLFKIPIWLKSNQLSLAQALDIKKTFYNEYEKRYRFGEDEYSILVIAEYSIYVNKLMISHLQRNLNKENKYKLKLFREELKIEYIEYYRRLKQYKPEYYLRFIIMPYVSMIDLSLLKELIYLGDEETVKNYIPKYNTGRLNDLDSEVVFRAVISSANQESKDIQEKLFNELYDILLDRKNSITVKTNLLKALGLFENKGVIDIIIALAFNPKENLYGKYRVMILKSVIENNVFAEYTIDKIQSSWNVIKNLFENNGVKRDLFKLFRVSRNKNIIKIFNNMIRKDSVLYGEVNRIKEDIEINLLNDEYN